MLLPVCSAELFSVGDAVHIQKLVCRSSSTAQCSLSRPYPPQQHSVPLFVLVCVSMCIGIRFDYSKFRLSKFRLS
jgi:hypothetical protein